MKRSLKIYFESFDYIVLRGSRWWSTQNNVTVSFLRWCLHSVALSCYVVRCPTQLARGEDECRLTVAPAPPFLLSGEHSLFSNTSTSVFLAFFFHLLWTEVLFPNASQVTEDFLSVIEIRWSYFLLFFFLGDIFWKVPVLIIKLLETSFLHWKYIILFISYTWNY